MVSGLDYVVQPFSLISRRCLKGHFSMLLKSVIGVEPGLLKVLSSGELHIELIVWFKPSFEGLIQPISFIIIIKK